MPDLVGDSVNGRTWRVILTWFIVGIPTVCPARLRGALGYTYPYLCLTLSAMAEKRVTSKLFGTLLLRRRGMFIGSAAASDASTTRASRGESIVEDVEGAHRAHKVGEATWSESSMQLAEPRGI